MSNLHQPSSRVHVLPNPCQWAGDDRGARRCRRPGSQKLSDDSERLFGRRARQGNLASGLDHVAVLFAIPQTQSTTASFCSRSLVAVSQQRLTFQLGRHKAISGWEDQCPTGGALALLNQRIIGGGVQGQKMDSTGYGAIHGHRAISDESGQ